MKHTTNYNLYKPEPTDAVNSNIPNAENMDIIDANLKDVSDLADLVDQGLTALAATVAGKVSKAGDTMSGALNMGGNGISGIPTSSVSSGTDAANKQYVDNKAANYLPLAGGTMTGDVAMGSHKVSGLPSGPFNAQDAVPKSYVDDAITAAGGNYLPLSGGTLTGALAMSGNGISGIPTSSVSEATAAANKQYVDNKAATLLPLTGGTMDGDIAMDGNNLEINDGELVFQTIAMHENGSGVLKIGEDAASPVTHIYGETILDALNMNGNTITEVDSPTEGNDVANKNYVDDAIGSAVGPLTPLDVTFTFESGHMSCNKTYQQMASAFTNGRQINATLINKSPANQITLRCVNPLICYQIISDEIGFVFIVSGYDSSTPRQNGTRRININSDNEISFTSTSPI